MVDKIAEASCGLRGHRQEIETWKMIHPDDPGQRLWMTCRCGASSAPTDLIRGDRPSPYYCLRCGRSFTRENPGVTETVCMECNVSPRTSKPRTTVEAKPPDEGSRFEGLT